MENSVSFLTSISVITMLRNNNLHRKCGIAAEGEILIEKSIEMTAESRQDGS